MTPWEVLLVDNDSTDSAAVVARSCWKDGPAPLRIVDEPRRGVRYARERGLSEAIYPFLAFVDDDNWVARDWLRTSYEIISSDSSLGAVGSIRTPTCDTSHPTWFADFHSTYAVLTASELEQIREPLEYLPTAGLCIRRAAWEKLIQNGFRFQLTGSIGESTQGGEDVELTRALCLSGWKLRIDPRLRLQHYMPSSRLQWKYLRKLQRSYSASDVILDAYSSYSLSLRPGFRRWLSDRWWYQFGKCLTEMVSRPRATIAAAWSNGEGSKEIIEIEKRFGRMRGLLQFSGRYSASRREVRDAAWRLDFSDTSLTATPIATESFRGGG
jgi:glycosyltransferase involved in cell wall biosynthesis